jgi:hypothetical protein
LQHARIGIGAALLPRAKSAFSVLPTAFLSCLPLKDAVTSYTLQWRVLAGDASLGCEKVGVLGMVKLLVITVVTGLLVVGCSHTDRQGLVAAGYAPEYVDGYVDGYSAGCNTIGHPFYRFARDTHRYEQNGQYKNGWQDGFLIARTDYAAIR